jgi:hypothetical protein
MSLSAHPPPPPPRQIKNPGRAPQTSSNVNAKSTRECPEKKPASLRPHSYQSQAEGSTPRRQALLHPNISGFTKQGTQRRRVEGTRKGNRPSASVSSLIMMAAKPSYYSCPADTRCTDSTTVTAAVC